MLSQNKNAVIIICTRPDSARLPRKAFKRVAGIPAIEHILTRLVGCQMKIILAVPKSCEDYNYLLERHQSNNDLDISLFQGSPDSPLHRMRSAYEAFGCEEPYIVRITHDDILIDQDTMIELVKRCKKEKASYGVSPKILEGAGVEVFTAKSLINAANQTEEPAEYISYFVKKDPIVKLEPRASIQRNYRLTMDYYQDWIVLDTILRKLGPFASNDQICEFLDQYGYILNLNKLPEISIYTCAYNAEQWIDETIHSVLSQHHTNFEYILVDDGSTDMTTFKASKYFRDERLRMIRNEYNLGLASSSNLAISKARGQYVMRLDADDSLKSGALNRMEKLLKDSGAGILYSSFNEIDKDSMTLKDRFNIDPQVSHHAGCALMDKRLINELRFSDGLKHYDSLELYNRIKGRFDIAYCEEALWYYRKHGKSLSANNTTERKETLEKLK